MPRLTVGAQVQTGQTILDHGITDLLLHMTDTGPMLYTTSGPTGGIAAFTIGGNGTLSLSDFTHFDPALSHAIMDRLTLLETVNGPSLVVAGDPDAGLTALTLDGAGRIGGQSQLSGLLGVDSKVLDLDQMGGNMLFLANPGIGSIQAYSIDANDPNGTLSRQFTVTDTPAIYADSVFAIDAITLAGDSYLIGASRTEQGVTAYRVTPTGLIATGNLGVAEGIGMMTPTALETITIGGRSFVLVASAPGDGMGQSGAITVMQLLSDGSLAATDHVIDTKAMRFGMVQSLEVVEAGGFTYVLAGGGDDGMTLFLLLPNGRLHLMDVLADDFGIGLENITAITTMRTASRVDIFVSSQISAGVTTLAFDAAGNGQMRMATAAGGDLVGSGMDDILIGGSGDDRIMAGQGADIIEDGAGNDTLTGGAGADRFILRADGGRDTITDFEAGRDRLDLSGWPFLYDPSQLTIQPTFNGALVIWRNELLVLQTQMGTPLSAAQVIAAVITAPDRSPIQFTLPEDPTGPTEGADSLDGTSGADVIDGLGGNDTIDGLGGDDTITGGAGFDRLIGGNGDDSLSGGAQADNLFGDVGNDTLDGEAGNDRLFGGLGHDSLIGGEGGDLLIGDGGNDTLNGGADDDRLFGGTGFDLLHGGAGADQLDGGAQADNLYGEAGNDTVLGGDGNDRLFGGEGDDSLSGSTGNDALFGEAGHDTLTGDTGFDLLRGGNGDDSLSGGGQADNLFGDFGDDTLDGGDGFDRLFGGAGHDLLLGGGGPDALFAEAGNDTLIGGDGDDRLYAGGGFDRLEGGAGNDQLWGNFNWDIFIFADGHGQDTIGDFEARNPWERIDLSQISALSGFADYTAFAATGAVTTTAGGVLIDTGSGNSILLSGVTLADLDNTDFIF
ncbi:calcium-binding protein [Roseicyclus sp.]|uniref:calcium-binding protein n=1 Tax=Roseicyclus sp. TaxID=1914329 RepID=UPI003F6C5A8A